MSLPRRDGPWLGAALAAAFLVGLLAGGVLMGLAGARANESPDGPDPAAVVDGNDVVRYHVTAFDGDDRVAFTSDPAVAQANPHVLADAALKAQVGERRGSMEGWDSAPPAGAAKFRPTQYMIGRHAGDTVATPFFLHPFGMLANATLPRSIGPLAGSFSVDLDAAYDDSDRAASLELYGERDALVAGHRFTYAGALPAVVEERNAAHAQVRLLAGSQEGVRSRLLGFNLTVEEAPGGEGFVLLPDLKVGDVFTTAGCKIPDAILTPGRYRVTGATAEGWQLRMDAGDYETLWDRPLRFEVTILGIEKKP